MLESVLYCVLALHYDIPVALGRIIIRMLNITIDRAGEVPFLKPIKRLPTSIGRHMVSTLQGRFILGSVFIRTPFNLYVELMLSI